MCFVASDIHIIYFYEELTSWQVVIVDVSECLLKEMGVMFVSNDRLGYGLNDVNLKQILESAAKDVAHVADRA